MNTIRTFEDLECWKACREVRLFVIRKILPMLPRDERFEHCSQIKKASRSTTANIAEGFGRFHYRDNYKFCSNSHGSLFEVLDHLISANDDGYVDHQVLQEGRELVATAARLLNGYMNYLQRAGSPDTHLREISAGYRLEGALLPWDPDQQEYEMASAVPAQ